IRTRLLDEALDLEKVTAKVGGIGSKPEAALRGLGGARQGVLTKVNPGQARVGVGKDFLDFGRRSTVVRSARTDESFHRCGRARKGSRIFLEVRLMMQGPGFREKRHELDVHDLVAVGIAVAPPTTYGDGEGEGEDQPCEPTADHRTPHLAKRL